MDENLRPAAIQAIGNVFETMFFVFLDCLEGGHEVSFIVEGIKNPEYVYTNLCSLCDKGINNIICIVPVSYKVLSPQQHLKPCVRHFFL